MSPPNNSTPYSITMICCCIGARPYKCPASPHRCGRISTTSWLTSIRTPTGCKPRSFSRWPDGAGVTGVGDDAQSIYAFRAATVRNILDFPDQFSPRAAVISLEHNYRSIQPILDAANAVIAQAREGFSKTLTSSKLSAELPHLVTVEDEMAQAVYVTDQILEHREAGID